MPRSRELICVSAISRSSRLLASHRPAPHHRRTGSARFRCNPLASKRNRSSCATTTGLPWITMASSSPLAASSKPGATKIQVQRAANATRFARPPMDFRVSQGRIDKLRNALDCSVDKPRGLSCASDCAARAQRTPVYPHRLMTMPILATSNRRPRLLQCGSGSSRPGCTALSRCPSIQQRQNAEQQERTEPPLPASGCDPLALFVICRSLLENTLRPTRSTVRSGVLSVNHAAAR